MKRITIGLAVVLAMALTTVAIPKEAGAATPTPPAPASAVAAVTAAQAAQPYEVGGSPSNDPTVATTSSGVTASSPSGTVGISLAGGTSETSEGPDSAVPEKSGATAVVTPAPGGVSVSQVIAGIIDPTKFTYKLSLPKGYRLVQEPACGTVSLSGFGAGSFTCPTGPTGLIAITTAKHGEALTTANTLGSIDPPTATDAKGNAQPTSYKISGTDTLTQTVNVGLDAVYPVVADPQLTFGWGTAYVWWNHNEVGSIAWETAIGAVGSAAALACTALDWFAGIGFVCTALFLVATALVYQEFQTAYNRGGGLVWVFAWNGTPLYSFYAGSWN